MKRRKFLTNTTLAVAAVTAPLGLQAMSFPSAALNASQREMLSAFNRTLKGGFGPSGLRSRLGTIASIEHADETTLRFRSLTGQLLELRRTGERVVTRVMA